MYRLCKRLIANYDHYTYMYVYIFAYIYIQIALPLNMSTIRLSTGFKMLHSLIGSGHGRRYVHLVNYCPKGAETTVSICTKLRQLPH